ncbi:DMT family transporter [Candidatus Pseudothioglobus sp. Uisw_016]|jgi:O-acetylserine/cysteine efflux transporter|uniref:DMT family transporter n=1 Tax=Candidatus Pseudothioglobus sp. Uisw_016 TaxID=3230995 RepID=UPI002312FDA8|nr:EamA family transporter [Gammaproteobacteria bacterium]MDA8905381.1 EamA family transporter [Candidatus Thioglobus sp.]MDB9864604.1 EamA family transporter [Candidatus Thioglobus sp.]
MNSKQILLALIVPITWGLGFTLAKIGMEQFPALLIMTIRFGIAGLILVWFTKPPWGHMREIFVVALIGSTIQYGLTYNGLKGIDASTAAILVQLEGPILAIMGAFLLKEKLGITRALGMGLAFIGVLIIAGEPRLDGHLDSVILLIAGSAVWAVAQIMISRLKDLSGITILAWVAIMATPQMFVASLLIEDGQWLAITTASFIDWSIILYLALIMTVLGYSVWYHLLSSVDVSKVSPFLMLLPITSIIAGIVLLDEKLTSSMILGGLLIMSGVASTLISWNWPRKQINL